MTQPADDNSSERLAPDADEARMRRALEFLSSEKGSALPTAPRQPEAKSSPQTLNLHSGPRPRRRFVEDGEVAVTVVSRQQPRNGPETSLPSQSRLTLAETALDHERAARQQAERDLHEALATVRALETKLGHAELQLSETSSSARNTLEELQLKHEQQQTQLRQELETERAGRLAAERAGRLAAERAGRLAAERADRLEAEQALAVTTTVQRRAVSAVPAQRAMPAQQSLLDELPVAKPKRAKALVKSKPVARKQAEPKPVKWWR